MRPGKCWMDWFCWTRWTQIARWTRSAIMRRLITTRRLKLSFFCWFYTWFQAFLGKELEVDRTISNVLHWLYKYILAYLILLSENIDQIHRISRIIILSDFFEVPLYGSLTAYGVYCIWRKRFLNDVITTFQVTSSFRWTASRRREPNTRPSSIWSGRRPRTRCVWSSSSKTASRKFNCTSACWSWKPCWKTKKSSSKRSRNKRRSSSKVSKKNLFLIK